MDGHQAIPTEQAARRSARERPARTQRHILGLAIKGLRGQVLIDPETRDIVQDEHVMEVYRKPDGVIALRIIDTVKQVKDQCKVLKVGRCGS